jgi:hypothetical protein
MRIVAVLAASVGAALIGSYLASPYLAVIGLVNAVRAGDKDGLEERVDFPAVREHLKAEITATFVAKLRDDPEMQSNPFAGLGLALIPMMADKAVDALVTPEGLSHLLAQGQDPADKKPVFGLPKDAGYITLDRFRVRAPAGKDGTKKIDLILRRQGLFHWTLTRIELPKNFLEDEQPVAAVAPESAAVEPSTQPPSSETTTDAAGVPDEAPSDGVPADAPPAVASLIRQWYDENDRCRGGSGDDPATGRACDERTLTDDKIDALDWCYGEDAEYGYQAKWARCKGR